MDRTVTTNPLHEETTCNSYGAPFYSCNSCERIGGKVFPRFTENNFHNWLNINCCLHATKTCMEHNLAEQDFHGTGCQVLFSMHHELCSRHRPSPPSVRCQCITRRNSSHVTRWWHLHTYLVPGKSRKSHNID